MTLSEIIQAIINAIWKPKPPSPPPVPPGPPPVPPTPPQPPKPPGDYAAELLALHNLERSKKGVMPLAMNNKLNLAAQGHAQWMADNRKMSHDQNGQPFTSRLKAAGYNYQTAGENIAMGQPTPTAVVQAWMNSPGHRANILRAEFRDVGFGLAVNAGMKYWCVDFGASFVMFGIDHEEQIFLSGPLGPEEEKPAIYHLT